MRQRYESQDPSTPAFQKQLNDIETNILSYSSATSPGHAHNYDQENKTKHIFNCQKVKNLMILCATVHDSRVVTKTLKIHPVTSSQSSPQSPQALPHIPQCLSRGFQETVFPRRKSAYSFLRSTRCILKVLGEVLEKAIICSRSSLKAPSATSCTLIGPMLPLERKDLYTAESCWRQMSNWKEGGQNRGK